MEQEFVTLPRGVVEQALNALDAGVKISPNSVLHDRLRAALEQPQVEQEPASVAKVIGMDEFGPMLLWHRTWTDFPVGTKLYTRPQNLNCKSNQARLATLWGYVKADQQHQRKLSNDNDLQRENGQLITSSSIVPAGWKLVPVEPTREMIEAGKDAHYEAEKRIQEPGAWKQGGFAKRAVRAAHVFQAMLAAAPQPPLAEQPQPVEMLGETCIDGGKCHHKCTDRCFRRECCAPFSDYSGPWKYEQTQTQAEQEPFFWYRPRSDGMYEGPLHKSQIERVRKESGGWVPLYTHPQPKREPLTDEQIDAIADAMPGGLEGFMKGWGWRQFARAVLEATHNIK